MGPVPLPPATVAVTLGVAVVVLVGVAVEPVVLGGVGVELDVLVDGDLDSVADVLVELAHVGDMASVWLPLEPPLHCLPAGHCTEEHLPIHG